MTVRSGLAAAEAGILLLLCLALALPLGLVSTAALGTAAALRPGMGMSRMLSTRSSTATSSLGWRGRAPTTPPSGWMSRTLRLKQPVRLRITEDLRVFGLPMTM